MSKKRKRALKRKQIKKPIVIGVEVVVEPIKPTKRKYHHKRKYIKKQSIAPIVQVEQSKVEYPVTIDKQQQIQFDIIPKKFIYGTMVVVAVMVIATMVVLLNIPPEPVYVVVDGSYLAVEAK